MKTISDLQFRRFDKNTSTKAGCPVSTEISVDDYLASKECSDNNKIVPYSGHQIIDGITTRLNSLLPDTSRNWGKVHVYRDQVRFDGYVERMTPETSRSQLLTATVPISDLVFERAIATIDMLPPVTHGTLGDISYRMAVKYGPKELEVAIGPNVSICNNFNIFGGQRFVASREFPYDLMMIRLEEAIKSAERNFGTDIQTIRMLADTPCDIQKASELLGGLQLAYFGKSIVLPITDVNAAAKEVASKGVNNYWDFLNACTQPLKFGSSSGEATLDAIHKVCDYVVDGATQRVDGIGFADRILESIN